MLLFEKSGTRKATKVLIVTQPVPNKNSFIEIVLFIRLPNKFI